MANTAQEARDMLAASRNHPDLVCQLTPTSTTYRIDNVLKQMIEDRYLGEVLSVEVQALQTRFADFDSPVHWRQDRELSGYNTLNIGASYESMIRWLGRGNRVMAMSKIHVPYRRNEHGDLTSVTIPDHVDILYELANGAQVHMRMSSTTGLSEGNQIWMHGTEGTIHVDRQQNVFAGRRGATELSQVPNPPDKTGLLSGRRTVHQRDSRQRADHHGPLRNGRPLHGVERSGVPQLPDRTGCILTVVNGCGETKWGKPC